MNKESFVLYESTYKQIEILEKRLGAEEAYKFIKAIMAFGLYGELPEEESSVWLYGFEQSITSISAAKTRYEAAVENGKKGGRPKKIDEEVVIWLHEEGETNAAIAEQLKCSVSSVEKILRKNRKNLNENENNNDNFNSNFNETDNASEIIRIKPKKKKKIMYNFETDELEEI
jgi:transposase